MKSTKKEMTTRLIKLLEGLYAEMRCSPEEEWSDVELTVPQLRTLVLLRQGPQRMGAVAEHLGTSLSSTTGMVDRLVDKGLMERVSDPSDRRVVACRLTPRGEGEVERFWRIKHNSVVALAEHLEIEELADVIHAIELLHSAACRASSLAPASVVRMDDG